ncbi:hypothetical protein FRB99_003418 [Tulasnella sp. 403]|nr:hypothetical protein FRB99_003418 [Tulasnella sp. 403]
MRLRYVSLLAIRSLLANAFIPLIQDEQSDTPCTGTRRKRGKHNKSLDDLEDDLLPKGRVKLLSSLKSSQAVAPSRFDLSKFTSKFTVSTVRTFHKIAFHCQVVNGEYCETNEKVERAEELRFTSSERKATGLYKGCWEGRYDGMDVAICIMEGQYGLSYTAHDNEHFLGQEARLLALGRLFCERFFAAIDQSVKEGHLKHSEVIRFTFNNAFIADFGKAALTTLSDMRKTKKVAARRQALVSPILPTWPKDFIKFIGSHLEYPVSYSVEMEYNISQAVFKKLQVVLMSFLHFIWEESGHSFVFADIQGAWSADQKSFIIADPQMHTALSKDPPMATWDSGQDGISSFYQGHKCSQICEALSLPKLEAQPKSAKPLFSSSLQKMLDDVMAGEQGTAEESDKDGEPVASEDPEDGSAEGEE